MRAWPSRRVQSCALPTSARRLDLRRKMRIRSDCASDLADGDLSARFHEALFRACNLRVVTRERDTERHGLGKDAVAPSDHRCSLVFLGSIGERREETVGALQE